MRLRRSAGPDVARDGSSKSPTVVGSRRVWLLAWSLGTKLLELFLSPVSGMGTVRVPGWVLLLAVLWDEARRACVYV